METIGIVTGINQKEKHYGIALGRDNWYNGFGTFQFKRGDKIKIIYEESKNMRKIEKVELIQEATRDSLREVENNNLILEVAEDLSPKELTDHFNRIFSSKKVKKIFPCFNGVNYDLFILYTK